jgi:hypothetical protein
VKEKAVVEEELALVVGYITHQVITTQKHAQQSQAAEGCTKATLQGALKDKKELLGAKANLELLLEEAVDDSNLLVQGLEDELDEQDEQLTILRTAYAEEGQRFRVALLRLNERRASGSDT